MIALILMICSVYSVEAQDSILVNKPVVSGFADAYFRYSFLNPPSAEDSFDNYTSFTNSHNSFELGMLSVKLEQSIGKVGLVGDLGFGKRAQDFSYNDENSMLSIKQLYLSYSPSKNFKFTGGSWATHIGYEVVDAPGNRNYSMSYMFSYGPFFHTGLKADYNVRNSGFMIGIVNPSDLKSANFSKKYVIGQYRLALAGSKINLSLNGLAGKMEKNVRNSQLDLVATAAISEKFSLGYNATLASSDARSPGGSWVSGNEWWGSAIYFNYDPEERLGITLRTEYFSDPNGATAPFLASNGGSVKAATLSFNGKISNLVLVPELRLEDSNRQIFTKKSGTASNSLSFIFGAYYKF
jgi:hypothetical protein